MDSIQVLLSVVLIWTIAVITPGPNFFIIIQTSLNKNGYYTVLGVALGTIIWAILSLTSLNYIIKNSPTLFLISKMLGGAYLIYLGVKLIFYSNNNIENNHTIKTSPISNFYTGLITNISNPKTMLFMTSLFASTLHESTSLFVNFFSVLLIFSISLLWYAFISYIVSNKLPKSFFSTYQKLINKVSGTIFILFGLNILNQK